ncbi:MAG: YhdP family protein, partial [Pseudomonas sp.]
MEPLARLLVVFLRATLSLCALGLVLAALYVSLGRELVPLVAEYRFELEEQAREALGVPLRIGRLEGRWHGLAPLLVAHDVLVGEGASAVRLDQVRVAPDMLASLLARQPRIANLELEGLQLSLKQDAGGQWALEGWPARIEPLPLEPAAILGKLQRIAQLSLLDSQVTFEPRGQAPVTLTYVSLSLNNGLVHQRLDGRLTLPDGQPLALHLRTRLQPHDWRAAEAELYLSLPQSDWARWLPASLTQAWRVERLQAGGEFWLSWARGEVQRAVARLHGPELTAAHAERQPVTLQNLALSAYFERNAEGYQVLLDSLAFSLGETRWGEVQLGLSHQAETAEVEEQWRLTTDRLEVAPLVPVLEALAPLPEPVALALQGLQPRGTLRNIQLDYRPQAVGEKRLQFAANLDRIGFNAYRGAPAAENVSGSVAGDLGRGELRLAADDFALHLDQLFPQPWRYRQANARLTWTLDEQAFTLISPYLQVVGAEGRVAGDFLIRLRRDPQSEDYMDLRVGLREGDARYTEKYLPTLSPGLKPELANWLKTAIRGGAVDEGYFQYQGSLNKGVPATARSLSLFFKVHDAELAFQPGWPALREARGEVFVEDSGVRVQVAEGRLLESRVQAVSVAIPHVEDGQTARLALVGELQSSLVDGLKILQEAPLGTAATFAGWQGEGPLSGKLKLDLPLSKGALPEVRLDFATEGARLKLSQPNLELTQLKGAFRYDTARGLSAADIRAQVFGRPVRAKAIAEGSRGHARTRIEASGQLALNSLTGWLGVTQPVPLSGELPYRLDLTLDGADSQLRVESSLKGLAVELPAPFGKGAEEERQAEWRMTLEGQERRYWLDYAELASLALAAPLGQLHQGRGELRLNQGRASLPGGKGLRVRGSLSELDWAAWQAALKPYAAEQGDEAKQLLRSADLQIGSFRGFGASLENLGVQLVRADGGWTLDLDSAQLKGRVGLPALAGAPIAVDLEYLRLPAAEPAPATASVDRPDPLAAVDPREIPALDLRIAQVRQGDQPLGAWSFKARPNSKG